MKYCGMSGWGSGGQIPMMIAGWLTYVLLVVLLCLAIAALWKYLSRKK